VDRLVVEEDRVLVVDFKTNRPAPETIEQADDAYLEQMAVYVAVLRAVFPQKRVEAALLWTDGPRLMEVPEAVIDRTLAALASG
jgi:ATP-dependent helicase/nuclease subunit A